MSLHVRTIVFLAAAASAVCAWTPGWSQPPGVASRDVRQSSARLQGAAPREQDERGAAAALTKLGVPLEYDPSGRVRWIAAATGEMSDEAMASLPELPLLEWLEIGGGRVTAAGLSHIKKCTALRRLYIHDIDLSQDALTWLAGLRLEALSLQRTRVACMNLKQLKATGSLIVLNLSENEIADEDLSVVAQFRNLEVLALQDTRITGAGLARLKDMLRLNVLNLVRCRIVDDDLKHMHSMSNLRIVQAAGCNLSDQAVKELTAKLTMLAVFR